MDANRRPSDSGSRRGRVRQPATHTTHGFTLYTAGGSFSGNLEFNDHRNGDVFHATSITSLTFLDDPKIDAGRPLTSFDTVVVSGVGRLNGVDGVPFSPIITDAGEPGRGDFFSITLGSEIAPRISRIAGTLETGNHQADPE